MTRNQQSWVVEIAGEWVADGVRDRDDRDEGRIHERRAVAHDRDLAIDEVDVSSVDGHTEISITAFPEVGNQPGQHTTRSLRA